MPPPRQYIVLIKMKPSNRKKAIPNSHVQNHCVTSTNYQAHHKHIDSIAFIKMQYYPHVREVDYYIRSTIRIHINIEVDIPLIFAKLGYKHSEHRSPYTREKYGAVARYSPIPSLNAQHWQKYYGRQPTDRPTGFRARNKNGCSIHQVAVAIFTVEYYFFFFLCIYFHWENILCVSTKWLATVSFIDRIAPGMWSSYTYICILYILYIRISP